MAGSGWEQGSFISGWRSIGNGGRKTTCVNAIFNTAIAMYEWRNRTMTTQAEAIIEAFKALKGIRTIKEIKDWVDSKSEKYGRKWKDFRTGMADMVPQSHSGNSSSNVSEKLRVLERMGSRRSGRYRLLNKEYSRIHEDILKGKKNSQGITIYEMNNAMQLLGKTYNDLKQIIINAENSHKGIQKSFKESGWLIEKSLLGKYRCDAYKDGIVVEIESIDRSSVIDVLHRDLFRFMMLYRMGKLKVGVLITSVSSEEVSLKKVRSDMEIYGKYYDVPLLVLGI